MIEPPAPRTYQSAALKRVARGDLCAGCGACAALAPGKVTMQMAAPGYLRPVQSAPVSADEDAAITAVCPGLGQQVAALGRADSVLWGPYHSMMTGWATDPALRFAGSSGGALSMMLVHLIETGTVDAVMQTAADPALSIGNVAVTSTDMAGIQKAAGSRYAPSAPLADLSPLGAPDTRYAFVGKPCDAAALRAMCDRDPDLARRFPVILSFFCAGVPSQRGAEQVLAALGTTQDDTAGFRYRGNGWPGQATATAHDGTERTMSYFDSWGKILSRHVQHRCKVCADGAGAAADIVCADAWESDAKGYPVFDDAPGISLIVARTELGAQLIDAARAAGRIETEAFDIAHLANIQPGQRARRRALLARLLALRLTARPVPAYRGLHILAAARQNTMRRNLKNFLGMVRRSLLRSRN